MLEQEKIELFNRKLDELLQIPSAANALPSLATPPHLMQDAGAAASSTSHPPSPHLSHLPSIYGKTEEGSAGEGAGGEVQELLQTAFQLSHLSLPSEIQPNDPLRSRWAAQARHKAAKPFNPLRWVWIGAVVIALALLIIFRQPVLASVTQLFGYTYIPETGFVRLETVRVLKNPVIQEHDRRSLTVSKGLATPKWTEVWIEFSEAAQPLEKAWLELPSGTKLEMAGWEWYPDEPGTKGLHLYFPVAGDESNQFTLALAEGWRLPLQWIPASEAGLNSAEVFAPYPSPLPEATGTPETGGETDLTTEVSSITQSPIPACLEHEGLRICVRAATTTQEGTRVLLEAHVIQGEWIPGEYSGSGFAVPDPLVRPNTPITLTDDHGWVLNLNPDSAWTPTNQDDTGAYVQTIDFPALAPDAKTAVLTIPALTARVPIQASIQIDLGDSPSAGQSLDIDQTVTVLGQTIHFNRALLEGSGTDLFLHIYSDTVEVVDGKMITLMENTRPEGADISFGGGFDPQIRKFELTYNLLTPNSGLLTGRLILPITGAVILMPGPFQLAFQAPPPLEIVEQTPEVVDSANFTPEPAATALPMSDFQYSGRPLNPGEAVFAVVKGSATALYVTNPQNNAGSEWLVTLPGKVSQVAIHPDRGGLDYMTTADLDMGSLQYQQLYTLRFTESQPKLLISKLDSGIARISWSADRHYMAYTRLVQPPGENSQWQIWLLDLSCRETLDCQLRQLPIPSELQLFDLAWAPEGYRLALPGTSTLSPSGASDIYLLELSEQGDLTGISNLTSSEDKDDQSPQWLPDGSGLVFSCSYAGIPANEYDLCRNNLEPGVDQPLLHLPAKFMTFVLSPDGKSVVHAVYTTKSNPGKVQLFNLEDQSNRTLAEAYFDQYLSFSPDGGFLAYISAEGNTAGKKVMLINLASGEVTLAFAIGDEGVITWLGW
jgi:hypothetical protein